MEQSAFGILPKLLGIFKKEELRNMHISLRSLILTYSSFFSGEGDPLIANVEEHQAGPVQGLDFNPFQHNLLASGGNDAEVSESHFFNWWLSC
jgi:hypothetical protein